MFYYEGVSEYTRLSSEVDFGTSVVCYARTKILDRTSQRDRTRSLFVIAHHAVRKPFYIKVCTQRSNVLTSDIFVVFFIFFCFFFVLFRLIPIFCMYSPIKDYALFILSVIIYIYVCTYIICIYTPELNATSYKFQGTGSIYKF